MGFWDSGESIGFPNITKFKNIDTYGLGSIKTKCSSLNYQEHKVLWAEIPSISWCFSECYKILKLSSPYTKQGLSFQSSPLLPLLSLAPAVNGQMEMRYDYQVLIYQCNWCYNARINVIEQMSWSFSLLPWSLPLKVGLQMTYPFGCLGEMSTGGPGWGISLGNMSTHICRRPFLRKDLL